MSKGNQGSIVYQMRNAPLFVALETKIKEREKAVTRAKKQGLPVSKEAERLPTMKTLKQYRRNAITFAAWARTRYGCKSLAEAHPHIQEYSDYLAATGKSDSSVHTYLAAVCRAYGEPLGKYDKPTRHAARYKQSRGRKAADVRADRVPDCSPRLYDFARMVGIRRDEYLHLRGSDLTQDESGYWCVVVRKGKGGKYQLQRIPDQYVDQVKAYFDGRDDDFVFTKSEMTNKLQFHRCRHQLAWAQYQYYAQRLSAEKSYQKKLTKESKRRWKCYAKKSWNPELVKGDYIIRGENRTLAEAAGFPIRYNRLALMAVSIFHLSHWRLDVTVSNYILAVAKDQLLRAAGHTC